MRTPRETLFMNVVFSRLIRSFLFPASVSSRILAWSSSVSLPPRSIPFGVSTVTSPTVRTSRLIAPPSPGDVASLLARPALGRRPGRRRIRRLRAGLRRRPCRGSGPLGGRLGRFLLFVLPDVSQTLGRLRIIRIDVDHLVEFRLRPVDLAAVGIRLGEPDVSL